MWPQTLQERSHCLASKVALELEDSKDSVQPLKHFQVSNSPAVYQYLFILDIAV